MPNLCKNSLVFLFPLNPRYFSSSCVKGQSCKATIANASSETMNKITHKYNKLLLNTTVNPPRKTISP